MCSVEPKPDGARFEGTIPCYLCLNKVRNSEWDSGDHRKRCAFKNQRELLNYARPYNAYCPQCREKLRLWPAKGHPFYCDECPGHKRFVLKRSTGHNRLNCFLCDYDVCVSCAAAKQDTIGHDDREENINNITTVITVNHVAEASQPYQQHQDQQPKPTQQYNPHTQNTLPYSQQQEAILPYNIQPGGTITYNLHHEQTPPHTQSEYSIPHSPQPEPDTTLPYNPQAQPEPDFPHHSTLLATEDGQHRFTTPFEQPTQEDPPPYESCTTAHGQPTTHSHHPSLPYPIKPYTQHNQTNPSDIVPTAPPIMKP